MSQTKLVEYREACRKALLRARERQTALRGIMAGPSLADADVAVYEITMDRTNRAIEESSSAGPNPERVALRQEVFNLLTLMVQAEARGENEVEMLASRRTYEEARARLADMEPHA